MEHIRFESAETVSPDQFKRFVGQRERMGDTSHYELLNGRVVMNPPAGSPHSPVVIRLQQFIVRFVWDRKLGDVFESSAGFELPSGDTVSPDCSFVPTARLKACSSAKRGEFFPVVPELVVEVLSDSNASIDRGEKKAIYERNGVREYWLVDTRAYSITIFGLRGDRFDRGTVFNMDDPIRSEVLAGLTFAPRELMPDW